VLPARGDLPGGPSEGHGEQQHRLHRPALAVGADRRDDLRVDDEPLGDRGQADTAGHVEVVCEAVAARHGVVDDADLRLERQGDAIDLGEEVVDDEEEHSAPVAELGANSKPIDGISIQVSSSLMLHRGWW